MEYDEILITLEGQDIVLTFRKDAKVIATRLAHNGLKTIVADGNISIARLIGKI